MAEPFGIVAGAVGIAAAFTACVDCFNCVQLGRRFGRDYQTDLISLNCARLRLTRWGQAVDIYKDPKLGRADASAAEVQTAKDILFQILILFADTESISKKYKIKAQNGDDLSVFLADDLDPTVMALANKMKELAIKRQKGSSILKTVSWALYYRAELQGLIFNITLLLDSLEKLFPAPQVLALVRQETADISDTQELRLVEEAARDVDNTLCTAAKEALAGHQYLNINIKGKSHTGDAYSSDWKGRTAGSSHTYDDVKVDKDGKALIGNKYGGKDFWDD